MRRGDRNMSRTTQETSVKQVSAVDKTTTYQYERYQWILLEILGAT